MTWEPQGPATPQDPRAPGAQQPPGQQPLGPPPQGQAPPSAPQPPPYAVAGGDPWAPRPQPLPPPPPPSPPGAPYGAPPPEPMWMRMVMPSSTQASQKGFQWSEWMLGRPSLSGFSVKLTARQPFFATRRTSSAMVFGSQTAGMARGMNRSG